MGPGILARIGRFPSTRFSSDRTSSGKLEIQSLQRFLLLRITVFLLGAAIPSPTLARAQSQSGSQQLDHQEVVSGDSSLAEAGLFTIHNPRNETLPYAEAQKIYLSACRLIEQEFNQSDAVRPRLTLFLGSDIDRVYYPKHEIQLRKWDKYKFAQGVVILAADAMLSEDKKLSLSRLAVLEAEFAVDVRELKTSPTLLHADTDVMKSRDK
jgi:hypothetical protein